MTARHVREDDRLKHVILIAQTGWGQDEDHRRSHEAGFDYHLVKPVPLETFEELLRNLPEKE